MADARESEISQLPRNPCRKPRRMSVRCSQARGRTTRVDSIWLWPLGLVAFLLAWPGLRVLGVRYLSSRMKSQALVEPPDRISLSRMSEGRWRNPVAHERSEEHTSELQSPCNLVCRLLLE